MSRREWQARWFYKVAVGAAVAAVLVGVARASTPGSDGRIYACYATSTGAVRIVESVADCRPSEKSVSWIQEAPAPPPFPMPLLVEIDGQGAGRILGTPGEIDCTTDCLTHLTLGLTVTLQANADPWSRFAGWSGDCAGTGSCVVTLSEARSVRALFVRPLAPVLVGVVGAGTVTSSPEGISCPPDCMHSFAYGSEVSLTATPLAGAAVSGGFAGLRCIRAPVNGCTFVVDEVNATELQFDFVHSLTIAQMAAGSVLRSPQGASCESTGGFLRCFYVQGTRVTLTARPDSNAQFIGWLGDCSGTGICELTMDADRSVRPDFLVGWTLGVAVNGTGQGSVTSNPVGISCPADCAEKYVVNSGVTLTATAAPGSRFDHWAGACSGTSRTCQVVMGFDRSAVAYFELESP